MMKKSSFRIDFQFLTATLVVIFVLLLPGIVHAGTFYHCIDKDGNKTLVDYPMDGQKCKEILTYDEAADPRGISEQWKHGGSAVVPPGDKRTRIITRGNSVLVPATLAYGNNEVSVHFLLDTGATGTTINTDIADQLSIDLSNAGKTKGVVVGGGVIEASVVRITSLTVGPHTIRNLKIFIVPHKGGPARFDGLIGMDVLRDWKYRVDFKNQVIVWE